MRSNVPKYFRNMVSLLIDLQSSSATRKWIKRNGLARKSYHLASSGLNKVVISGYVSPSIVKENEREPSRCLLADLGEQLLYELRLTAPSCPDDSGMSVASPVYVPVDEIA